MIGHFRVVGSLCFKARLSANDMKMILILMQVRIIFTRKIFALSLVLGTREWPIDFEVNP